MTRVRRRTLLLATAAAGALPLTARTGAVAAPGAPSPGVPARAPLTSQNGWEMETVADSRGSVYTRPVPGTPLSGIQLRLAEVESTLVYVVQRFHREVDELRDGDVVGWHPPRAVRRRLPESNLASGTAVRIRSGHCPPGSRGGFFPNQVSAIHAILADLGGVVRWGGDDSAVDEALFYLAIGPGDQRLGRVVRNTTERGAR